MTDRMSRNVGFHLMLLRTTGIDEAAGLTSHGIYEPEAPSYIDSGNSLSKRHSLHLPPVSIIVPVKNERENIESCIKSLLNLDYEEYEILLVDTGSTDGTYQVAKEIARLNPRVCVLLGVGNAASGRNLGLEVAKGDFVAFIDGDCTAPTDWLKKLVQPLAKEPVNTAGVGGPNIPTSPKENIWTRTISAVLSTVLGSAGSVQVRVSNNEYVRSISTANSAFRTNMVRKVGGFDPRLELCEDSDLCRRLIKTGSRLKFVKDATVYHRREYYSLRKFGQHMFGYGRGRGEAMLAKPGTNTSLTSSAITSSSALVILLLILSTLGSEFAAWLLVVSAGIYFFAVFTYALVLSKGIPQLLAASISVFLILHASYTGGLIVGMLSGMKRKVRVRQRH